MISKTYFILFHLRSLEAAYQILKLLWKVDSRCLGWYCVCETWWWEFETYTNIYIYIISPNNRLYVLKLQHKPSPTQPSSTSEEPPPDLWKNAGLETVVTFLKNAIRQGIFRPDPLVPLQVEPSRAVFEKVRATLGWAENHVVEALSNKLYAKLLTCLPHGLDWMWPLCINLEPLVHKAVAQANYTVFVIYIYIYIWTVIYIGVVRWNGLEANPQHAFG